MTNDVTRRSLVAFGAGMATLAIARPAITAALGMPVGKTILTITGKITNVNSVTAQVISLEGGIDRSRLSTSQRVNGTAR